MVSTRPENNHHHRSKKGIHCDEWLLMRLLLLMLLTRPEKNHHPHSKKGIHCDKWLLMWLMLLTLLLLLKLSSQFNLEHQFVHIGCEQL